MTWRKAIENNNDIVPINPRFSFFPIEFAYFKRIVNEKSLIGGKYLRG